MKINYTSEKYKLEFEVDNGIVCLLTENALPMVPAGDKKDTIINFLAFLCLSGVNIGNERVEKALELVVNASVGNVKPVKPTETLKIVSKPVEAPKVETPKDATGKIESSAVVGKTVQDK